MPTVTLHAEGAVSVVTLNRPERLNAINAPLLAALVEAMHAAQADPATRAIVFTGAGRAFCAGDDLKDFPEQAASAEAVAETCACIQQVTREIVFGDKLVIAAARGFAVGGGFEWLLNCDLVVAGSDLQAFFPELQLGHFVTGGVTRLLPQALGHARAVELLVLGERHDAQALLALGLVNRVVPPDRVAATALALAAQVAERAPHAVRRLKRVLTTLEHAQLSQALEHERRAAADCFTHPETARRIAGFLTRR